MFCLLAGMCCVIKSFLETESTLVFLPQIENPQQTEARIPSISKLDELVGFIGVAYKTMGEGLLIGAERTQRQLYHQAHFTEGESPQSWEPGAHCTAFRQLIKLEGVFSRCLSGPN